MACKRRVRCRAQQTAHWANRPLKRLSPLPADLRLQRCAPLRRARTASLDILPATAAAPYWAHQPACRHCQWTDLGGRLCLPWHPQGGPSRAGGACFPPRGFRLLSSWTPRCTPQTQTPPCPSLPLPHQPGSATRPANARGALPAAGRGSALPWQSCSCSVATPPVPAYTAPSPDPSFGAMQAHHAPRAVPPHQPPAGSSNVHLPGPPTTHLTEQLAVAALQGLHQLPALPSAPPLYKQHLGRSRSESASSCAWSSCELLSRPEM